MPKVIDISKENAAYQHLEVLKRNRNKRKQYREVFVEGVACINALVRARWQVTSVAYARERKLSRWAQGVIAESSPEKILRLSLPLMEKLSDRSDPSELILTAERRERRLEQIAVDERSIVVIFDRPSNHGNLGSIIRTCDGLGATAVVTMGHSVDIFDPTVLRSSLGAFFRLPVVECPSPKELAQWIDRVRTQVPAFRLLGAVADASTPLYEVDLAGPVGVVLGNEAHGVSRAIGELVDANVSIPMRGEVDSLNVACAGTAIVYEITRQRACR